MSVAIVNNFHPFIGIGKYAFNLFDKFTSEKKDVKMIYLESKDNVLEQRDGVIKVKQNINLPILNKTLSWYFYFPRKIPEGFELYHMSSGFLSKVAIRRKPSIITHMDLAPILFEEYPAHMRFLTKRVFRHYREAEKILTISHAAREELLSKTNFTDESKVVAVPLGYDENVYEPKNKILSRKKLGLPQDKKIILNVGSEEVRKNIPTLLKALNLLKKDISDFVYVHLGRTENIHDKLKKGLDIIQLKNIPEHDMPFVYSSSDVFVFPATYEGGFAYPPLEAMACGVPTIVTKELEMFRGGPAIVDNQFDEMELKETILKFLSDDKSSRILSSSSTKTARKFTLSKEAANTWRIYDEVLGRK